MRRREGGDGSRCVGGGVGGGNGLECEVEGGVERAEGSGEKRVGGGAEEGVPSSKASTVYNFILRAHAMERRCNQSERNFWNVCWKRRRMIHICIP